MSLLITRHLLIHHHPRPSQEPHEAYRPSPHFTNEKPKALLTPSGHTAGKDKQDFEL